MIYDSLVRINKLVFTNNNTHRFHKFACFEEILCIVGCITENIKAPGSYVPGAFRISNVISEYDCQVKHCRLNDECKYFTYIPNDRACYLKTDKALEKLDHEGGVIFGPRNCKSKLLSN